MAEIEPDENSSPDQSTQKEPFDPVRRKLLFQAPFGVITLLNSLTEHQPSSVGMIPPPPSISAYRQLLDAAAAKIRRLENELEQQKGANSLPFRSKKDAFESFAQRQVEVLKEGVKQRPALYQLLAATTIDQSKVGIVNWPTLDETEDFTTGHFAFPISPYKAYSDDGKERFILLGNNYRTGGFRYRHSLEETHRRIFDRGVWTMMNGGIGTAVVEFERSITPQKVQQFVRDLYDAGIRNIICGNETNNPFSPERDILPVFFEIFTSIDDIKKQVGMSDLDVSTPGLAYYGNGEYLQKMIQLFKELQSKKDPGKDPAKNLPFQRIADHFYGPSKDLVSRIRTAREIMNKEGVGHLKYDLTEVGNPTADPGQERAGDVELAEGHIPQITSLAIGSGMVDRLYYYSLVDPSDISHSLTAIEDGRLIIRAQYNSLVIMAKLLSYLKNISLTEEETFSRVDGVRHDGIKFSVAWSNVTDKEVTIPVADNTTIFDAHGEPLENSGQNTMTLKPKTHPYLAGPAKILISRR